MIDVKKISCLPVILILMTRAGMAQDYPRVETFLGYTYFRANSATNVPAFSANGGGGQFEFNASKHFGVVYDMGAVHNGNIGGHQLDNTFLNFMLGPRLNLRYSRLNPYFNALFGGVRATTSTALSAVPVPVQPIYIPGQITPVIPTNSPVTLRAKAAETGFAMTAGGGLDIKLSHHVSFRPVGLDYMPTHLHNFRGGGDNWQHNLRYTAGINFLLGGEQPAPPPPPPPPPPMRSCWDGSSVPMTANCPLRNMDLQISGARTDLCSGDSATLSVAGAPPDATYEWSINGQPTSKGPQLQFGTTGRDAGSYKVDATATHPEYNVGSATSTVGVRAYTPPTGVLDVSPAEIIVGQKATLAPRFQTGQCPGTLRSPVITASEGSVSGDQFDSTTVSFDPSATTEQRKTVTLVAKASDGKGEGTAQATIVVKKPVQATRLPDIVFPAGSARVNNCGKRVLLEELKTAIERDPGGKVVLVGHTSAKEAGKAGLDEQRALNAAAVISAATGVCSAFPASQTMIGTVGATDNGVDYQSQFCGSSTRELAGSAVKESDADAKYRRVEVWFVPSGSAMPASVPAYKDASTLNVSKLGCPR
jgi:hypothetical protein